MLPCQHRAFGILCVFLFSPQSGTQHSSSSLPTPRIPASWSVSSGSLAVKGGPGSRDELGPWGGPGVEAAPRPGGRGGLALRPTPSAGATLWAGQGASLLPSGTVALVSQEGIWP